MERSGSKGVIKSESKCVWGVSDRSAFEWSFFCTARQIERLADAAVRKDSTRVTRCRAISQPVPVTHHFSKLSTTGCLTSATYPPLSYVLSAAQQNEWHTWEDRKVRVGEIERYTVSVHVYVCVRERWEMREIMNDRKRRRQTDRDRDLEGDKRRMR